MEIEDVDEPEDAAAATPANGTVGQVMVGDALPGWGAVPSAATLAPGPSGSGRAGGNRHLDQCITAGCPNRAKTKTRGLCGACDGQGFRSSRDNTKLCEAECCCSLPEKKRRPQFEKLKDGTPVCLEAFKGMHPELLCIVCNKNLLDRTCPEHKKCGRCRKVDPVDKAEAIAQLCEEEGIEEAPADHVDANEKQRYAKWNNHTQKAQVFVKRPTEYKRACAVHGCVKAAKSVKVGYCDSHETQMKKIAAA